MPRAGYWDVVVCLGCSREMLHSFAAPAYLCRRCNISVPYDEADDSAQCVVMDRAEFWKLDEARLAE